MTFKLLASVAASSALALWAGQASAAIFTVNLSGGPPTFQVTDDGFNTVTSYTFDISGFDPANLPSVQVGDEVILNLTFADGAITLPATSYIDVTSFYITGDGFPLGDTATHGTTTLFSGGIGGAVVSSGTEGDASNFGTTTSDGVASDQNFFNVPAMTFDSLTTDFFIDRIAGSTDPGTFGTLGRAYFSADSRTLDVVPEPSAWALMLLGFGGLGAVLRARRQVLAI
jgi:hypothetical protein